MFVAYNPRQLRIGLFVGAVLCAALTAYAFRSGLGTDDALARARGGIAAGLGFAFLYVFTRLRPRDGWGVSVEAAGITISRPLSAAPIEIRWDQLRFVERSGKRREQLVLFLKNGGRVLIARHLFASVSRFEEVARAIDERAPRVHDA